MKIYEVVIEPMSPFGTVLKGDTIFGHFCWQAATDPTLLDGGLDRWLGQYTSRPFAIFSSAWPVLPCENGHEYALSRPPILPGEIGSGDAVSRKQKMERRKMEKKRKWLLVSQDLRVELKSERMRSDLECFHACLGHAPRDTVRSLRGLSRQNRKLILSAAQPHNSINRLTMTTGTGPFAPFSHENHHYMPGLKLAIFVGADEEAVSVESLLAGLERIGSWGYGRDASAGLGKFIVHSVEERTWPTITDREKGCLTLGPVVPEKNTFLVCYGTPFTRFGRHGASLACSRHPFKKPVLMADDSSIMIPRDRAVFHKPYIGMAVQNISAADPRTVMQGYSLYLPC